MKKFSLGLAFFLLFTIPQMVMAISPILDTSGKEIHDGHNRHQMHQNCREKMRAKERKLLSLVSRYTPEKKAEWVKVMAERDQLRAKWFSPEFSKKREQWKKEKQQRMAEREQRGNGEVPRKHDHETKIGRWKMYHQLKSAVESDNDKQAAKILNQILMHYKKHNEVMKKALNEK